MPQLTYFSISLSRSSFIAKKKKACIIFCVPLPCSMHKRAWCNFRLTLTRVLRTGIIYRAQEKAFPRTDPQSPLPVAPLPSPRSPPWPFAFDLSLPLPQILYLFSEDLLSITFKCPYAGRLTWPCESGRSFHPKKKQVIVSKT